MFSTRLACLHDPLTAAAALVSVPPRAAPKYFVCVHVLRCDTQIDPAVGANAVVSILLPTAGERLDVVLKCLLGASSQRSWPSSSPSKAGRGDGLRVIVLDEKRRKVCM